MNMRTLARIGAAILAAATLVVALQLPANADTPYGYLTLHQHQYQSGDSLKLPVSHPKLKNASFNDKASSAYNRTTSAWVLYEDTDYQGTRRCIRPGESVDDLHLGGIRFGDKISAARRLSTASCDYFPTFY